MPPVDGTPAPEAAPLTAPVAAPVAASSPATVAPTPAATPAPGSDQVAPKESAPAAGEAPKTAESLLAAKPADAKPPEAAPASVEPIDVTKLKLPEGFTLHDQGKEQLGALLKEHEGKPVSAAFVESLLVHHAAEVKALSDRQVQAWDNMNAEWANQVKADPDIGGRNLEPVLQSIGKVIDHFGGKDADDVRNALTLTGAGNNPHIVRLFHRMAKVLNEGGYVGGDTARPARKGPAETLWPADESGQVRSTVRNSR